MGQISQQPSPWTTHTTVDMYGKTGDSTYQMPRLNPQTHALNVIDYEHHEIHNGSHFFVVSYQDLAINNVLDFTLLTPNTTKWAHFSWDIATESETLWQVYETAVATNPLSGTVTPRNSDRNSGTASTVTLKYELQADLAAANGDTDVTTATLIESGISGAGKNGGEAERNHEIILKQNTLYCFRATATAAGYINFNMQWYEHTNKTA